MRSYSGLVPKVSQSGQAEHHGGITKAGDRTLRQAAFMAADMARRTDPQLAAKYVRLMNAGRHHDSAVCHIATVLLTRIAACLRTGQPYVIRDLDGTAAHRSRRPPHRHRAPPGRPQDPRHERRHPQVPTAQAQDEPGVTEVAERSNIPARHHQAYEPPRGLTSLRNSLSGGERGADRCFLPREMAPVDFAPDSSSHRRQFPPLQRVCRLLDGEVVDGLGEGRSAGAEPVEVACRVGLEEFGPGDRRARSPWRVRNARLRRGERRSPGLGREPNREPLWR